ncbi:MAG: DUF3016 domain-containing protein [Dokdonella sp.]
MKYLQGYKRLLWSMAVVLAFGCAIVAADEAPPPVKVDWTDPSAFAEVRQNACHNRVKPEEWLTALARHVQRRAGKVIAAGQHLDVTLTDIRRAGACEPWRGPRWDDVRVVKDIYSPRIDLRYTLTTADGKLVRSGEATLRDLGFLNRATASDDDPLRFEKRMLDDWLRREFAPG